jgi:hypothetical protein
MKAEEMKTLRWELALEYNSVTVLLPVAQTLNNSKVFSRRCSGGRFDLFV